MIFFQMTMIVGVTVEICVTFVAEYSTFSFFIVIFFFESSVEMTFAQVSL